MKEYRKRPPQRDAEADGVIEGRNAVIEALRAGTAIDKIYLAKGDTDSALGHIANTARAMAGVPREIQIRHIYNCSKADPAYGKGVADALGIPMSEVKL